MYSLGCRYIYSKARELLESDVNIPTKLAGLVLSGVFVNKTGPFIFRFPLMVFLAL